MVVVSVLMASGSRAGAVSGLDEWDVLAGEPLRRGAPGERVPLPRHVRLVAVPARHRDVGERALRIGLERDVRALEAGDARDLLRTQAVLLREPRRQPPAAVADLTCDVA